MFLSALAGLFVEACAMQGKGLADQPASAAHRPEEKYQVTRTPIASGFAEINSARIYYETAGDGPPFVMIHAGVADSRQWNGQFAYFSREFRVLRYDMRGYGKSEPVAGDYNHLQDLIELLRYLKIDQPLIVMGCSMGGGIAMDLALEQPSRVKAIIMVGSAPTGLELDVRTPAKFQDVEKAYARADYDRVAELQTQIWFDGEGRSPTQVDPDMRRLAYDMSRLVLSHEAKQLGTRLQNTQVPAAKRLSELSQPVLVIAGEHDTPYIRAAAAYMADNMPTARLQTMADAAHLPNLDHPEVFQRLVATFLSTLKASGR
jgi:pimeloyl-ACP methyl ester carboxylesterase